MAAFVNRIGGDYYKVQVDEGGEIVFDVGSNPLNPGKVTINGDLDVLGETTTIGSSELVVADKTITVAAQDPASVFGVPPDIGGDRFAGIIVDRGLLTDALLVYDEDLITYDDGVVSINTGAWIFKKADNSPLGIYASSIVTPSGELSLKPNGAISVRETADYEENVFNYDISGNLITDPGRYDKLAAPIDDDYIPNIRAVLDYVRDYHVYNFQDRIQTGELSLTRVLTIDQEDDALQTSRVEISVDGTNVATFYQNRFEIENLKLDDNVITSNGTNGTIILRGTGTGVVQMDDHVNYTIQTDPTTPVAGTTVYSKSIGDGGTGLFFTHQDGTNDELISRNKSLLYSIIF